MRSPVRFFKTLQSIGCNTWKLLKKYPWLKPLAWLYQLFRWGSRGMRRQDAIGGLLEDVGKAKREDVFLDKLGVTRRSKMEM